MLKHFAIYTVVEAVLIMTVLAVFGSYRDAASGGFESARSVMFFGAAVVVTNAVVYAQNRKVAWESLRFSHKVVRVAIALATTFALFLAGLAVVKLGSDTPPVALVGTAMMAAFGIGSWALILMDLARYEGSRSLERAVAERSAGSCARDEDEVFGDEED